MPPKVKIIKANVTFGRGDKVTVNEVIQGSLSAEQLQDILDDYNEEP
jgi:hypothetical protein